MNTVVFFSDIPWSGLHQRPQHMALAFSKRWPVLWVEPTTLLKRAHLTLVRISENIYSISVPVIPYNARYRWMQSIARSLSRLPAVRSMIGKIQVRLIRKALGRLGAESIVAFIENFHLLDTAEALSPSMVIYDYIDNAFGFAEMPEHIRRLWLRTVKKADAITVTSPELAGQIRPYRTEGVHHVGNGVEYSWFADPPELPDPPDLPAGWPIVGYTGAVYPWLDYDLLHEVCTNLKDVNFVFIGPVHPTVRKTAEELFRLPNVFTLGFKSYKELPGYLRRFSAGIIPFRFNELTRSVNPVKLYEYSAAGKPVVATGFSEDVRAYAGTIFLADSPAEFTAALQQAIAQSGDPSSIRRLKEFALGHDWDKKCSTVIDIIEQFMTHHHVS